MNRTPLWGQLPALVLTKIYENLNFHELLRVSTTCRHWRGVFFQKRLFRDFNFILNVDDDKRCAFFMHVLINLTNRLTISFEAFNVYHLEKVRRILCRIARSKNVDGLRFHTTTAGEISQYPDEHSDIEKFFIEPLKMLLGRRIPSFKVLDLGALEPLSLYATDFLKAIGKPQDLNELAFASIKYNPSHYPVLMIEPMLFEKCTSLQVLSLDYDTLNDELVQTIQLLPLKKLMICVHGLDETHPGVSESAWAAFNEKFETIDLILTLVYAYEAVDELHHHILRPSMPVTHLRVMFCNLINVNALDFMSRHYKDTIKSIWWIDSAFQEGEKSVRSGPSGQDPFVMMSWQCKNLQEIVIHGYVLDTHNLVGISRLRGKTLKKLEVSMLDPPLTSEMTKSFVEEISTQLGQKWRPRKFESLHPALGYLPVSDDVRDEFVLNLLRSDLAN